MRHLLTIITLLAFTLSGLQAATPDDLDSLFAHLSRLPGATTTAVDYTGGWPDNKGISMGFVMQRGKGSGMTTGQRLTIPSADINLIDSVLDIFYNIDSWGTGDYLKTYAHEPTKTVYGVYGDEASGNLYLLRVNFENEPCVPIDWHTRSHYDATDPNTVGIQVSLYQQEINWMEAVVRLYDEVRYNYIFYDKIKGRWQRFYNRALKQMASASDDYERGRILQQMIAACGDGHTYIMLPRSIETAGSSPFTTVMLPDGLYVRTVESHEMIDSGMSRGQKIIAVNGEAPEVWAKRELLPYVCSSTPQWTVHQMYDGYNFSRARNGSAMNLTLQNPDGTIVELAHSVNGPKWDSSLAQIPTRGFATLDGNIGLLTIPDFQTSDVYDYFLSILPEIMTTNGLIIDLRGNGGGNSGHAFNIASHLINAPAPQSPWTSRMYIPAFESWGVPERTYVAAIDSVFPADSALYAKPIAVLINRATFSAAEDFAIFLRDAGRAMIVGTPSGGSTGNGVRPLLTHTIMANICSKHDRGADGTEFVGVGVIPDIVVEESAESFFDPGRDDVVDQAAKALATKRE